MVGITSFLVGQGFECRALGVTAGEGGGGVGPLGELAALGVKPRVRPKSPKRKRLEYLYELRGVGYHLIDTGRSRTHEWERRHSKQFDQRLAEEISNSDLDIVFTYGGYREQHRRLERLKRKGVRLVLGLRSHGYYEADKEFFEKTGRLRSAKQPDCASFFESRWSGLVGSCLSVRHHSYEMK